MGTPYPDRLFAASKLGKTGTSAATEGPGGPTDTNSKAAARGVDGGAGVAGREAHSKLSTYGQYGEYLQEDEQEEGEDEEGADSLLRRRGTRNVDNSSSADAQLIGGETGKSEEEDDKGSGPLLKEREGRTRSGGVGGGFGDSGEFTLANLGKEEKPMADEKAFLLEDDELNELLAMKPGILRVGEI